MNDKEIRSKLEAFTQELETIKTPDQYHDFQKRMGAFVMNSDVQHWLKKNGETDPTLEKFSKAFSKFINEVIRPQLCKHCGKCSEE